MNWLLLKNSLFLACGATLLTASFGFLAALFLASLPSHGETGSWPQPSRRWRSPLLS